MFFFFFFFNDTATTEIYTLSLHDALPISSMPTRPRDGSSHPIAGSSRVFDGACMIECLLVVFPIRIVRMLEVPQWSATSYHRDPCKVVRRRGRRRRPLEGPCVPRVASGALAFEIRKEQVGDEGRDAGGLKEHPDRDDEVVGVPAAAGLVGVDS